MLVGFIIWSMVAVLLLGIGINCHRSKEAVGFFTHVKPPNVKDVARYNSAVGMLLVVASIVFEIIGIPFLFLEQNSPYFIFLIFPIMIWTIAIIVVYLRIEAKYKL